ncbi:MAG: exodeoxyribonuclease III [Coriobacteriaceae bacterium]|nr:exodeoxyribonuclease III [Coriobacteriaceae bacterium]
MSAKRAKKEAQETQTFVSWNVNGLRAVAKKGFEDIFRDFDADIFAVQETKLQEGQNPLELSTHHDYWSYAERKGYSGTAVFSKREPLQVVHGMSDERFDVEGRVTALEFEDFWFVCVYTPNSQDELKRIDYRCAFEDCLRAFLSELAADKSVVMCGDLNVAHEPIDLARPAANVGNAGFSDEERGKMDELLEAGFLDSFRVKYPDREGCYSWWSYRQKARERNVGWRIDYFIVSEDLRDRVVEARIHDEVFGSDHCPISLTLAI